MLNEINELITWILVEENFSKEELEKLRDLAINIFNLFYNWSDKID